MTVQEQIDKLKSDIAIHKEALQVYEKELDELEKQAVDTWKEAKNWCNHWESHFSEFSPQRKIVSYARHLENSLAAAEERANNTEPLCPRRIVATAAVVIEQSLNFLNKIGQFEEASISPIETWESIRLLNRWAGTEAKPYKTIAVEDLDSDRD